MKSVLVVISKLSDRTINGDLLKQLAKTANDEQPGIRTNTTICLGKIAKNLGTSSRSKVLIAAFTRSLRDPFVHARNAALMALAATAEYFNDDDSANRVLPVICPALIDKEKMIRDQASRTMDIYLQKVRKAAAAMPDSVLPPPQAADAAAAAQTNTVQPSASSGGGGWAGWAISSFTNKLSAVAGEMQTENGSPPVVVSPSPTPEVKKPATASASSLHRQTLASPPPPSGPSTPSVASAIAGQFLPDDDDDAGDAWGDLPDDDTFETPSAAANTSTSVSTTPFGEDEPDFAGWLAAQAQKKGPSKPLPKGLSKTSTAKKPVAKTVTRPAAKPTPKPAASKKIDLTPKETDDDDGWGDGW